MRLTEGFSRLTPSYAAAGAAPTRKAWGVTAILKEIRSMEDKDGNRYEIGLTLVYQVHRGSQERE